MYVLLCIDKAIDKIKTHEEHFYKIKIKANLCLPPNLAMMKANTCQTNNQKIHLSIIIPGDNWVKN